ncbi:DUF6152 family protein [Methylocella silvestris]|uniref:DUF6152 family protein n=1 Tax=Methylocella silvestris TaxID=199596 RepID=UPI0015E08162|nr:DUF6152 family protein [Methylocella silvestris]
MRTKLRTIWSWKSRAAFQGVTIAMLAITGPTLPAFAHHSFAAYDMAQEVSGRGAIKEFHWGAPHCAIIITVQQADGSSKDLLLVSVAPQIFAMQGFSPKAFHTGDEVSFSYHPNRTGAEGGSLASLTFPDGRVFKAPEAGPPPVADSQPTGGAPPPAGGAADGPAAK